MKTKNFLPQIGVIFILLTGLLGGYVWGRAVSKIESDTSSQNYLPPLIELDAPPQTVNGITADLESYYADGLRLIFAIRITGNAELYIPDLVYITFSASL